MQGHAIQYEDVLYDYKDLPFHETWRFNCHKEDSVLSHKVDGVLVEREGEEPAFVGTAELQRFPSESCP